MTTEVTARFEAVATSPGQARRFVRAAAAEWELDGLAETAALLLSELIANVVLHARTGCRVVVRCLPDGLRVEVHDGSSRLPVRKLYRNTATTGRGLELVAKLSSRWGVEPSRDGKSVWFELERNLVEAP